MRTMKIWDEDFFLSSNFDVKELHEFMKTIRDLPCYVQEQIHNDLYKKAIKNEMTLITNRLSRELYSTDVRFPLGVRTVYHDIVYYIEQKYPNRYDIDYSYDGVGSQYNFRLSTKYCDMVTYLTVDC